ncbi:uncharacterized protein BT62DRAFT_1078591 [Guyanagaster necrorhizus]|uniref:Uncharacterized protein n=1 Tax=Guyanagaster necrorhizus TaxID=856835 RepID=A0A9P8AQU8_9AGAR|nr:uncharacterized protein BT62DRAFT_1078591 [Guyanagaster necrorhizus MCA 3950]KAG7443212.1 hypothetical protein BT62DRAFT_1078591 [Guyanagaster necrorhizus MCA 3950]
MFGNLAYLQLLSLPSLRSFSFIEMPTICGTVYNSLRNSTRDAVTFFWFLTEDTELPMTLLLRKVKLSPFPSTLTEDDYLGPVPIPSTSSAELSPSYMAKALSLPPTKLVQQRPPPFAFIVHQKWDSKSKISSIPGTLPLLMLSGQMDPVVPKVHMKKLWELRSPRDLDIFKSLRYAGHEPNAAEPHYWNTIETFLTIVLQRQKSATSPP